MYCAQIIRKMKSSMIIHINIIYVLAVRLLLLAIFWSCLIVLRICKRVFTWKEHVHQLTVGGPGPELLHLGYLGLEVGVDPGQHLVPGEILIGHRGVEHIDGHPQTETDTDCQLAARFLPQSQCGRLISAPQLGHFLPWHCTRYHSHCSGLVGLPW